MKDCVNVQIATTIFREKKLAHLVPLSSLCSGLDRFWDVLYLQSSSSASPTTAALLPCESLIWPYASEESELTSVIRRTDRGYGPCRHHFFPLFKRTVEERKGEERRGEKERFQDIAKARYA